MPRAVAPWAAMPQARNASSTIAANGLLDQSPNDVTTAVETGSMSLPAATAAGSGCASVTAKALRITSPPTLSSAIQIARGTRRAALRVSSAAATVASKPMKAQPATASAASMAANVLPPDSASAPNVLVSDGEVLLAEHEQQREADADGGDRLAVTPIRSAALSASTPNAFDERADRDEHRRR